MLKGESINFKFTKVNYFLPAFAYLVVGVSSMQLKKIALILVTMALFVPVTAKAGDVNVQSGNVRVTTSRDGGIEVDSGTSRIRSNARYDDYDDDDYSRSRVYTNQSSTVRVNNGNRRVYIRNVPQNNVYYRNGRRYYRNSKVTNVQRNYCGGRTSIQQNTQVTGSRGRIVQRSVSSTTCR